MPVFNLGIGYSQRLAGDQTAFNAEAIALMPFRVAESEAEGYWVISSPNTYWVPTVMIGVHEVFLRADGHCTTFQERIRFLSYGGHPNQRTSFPSWDRMWMLFWGGFQRIVSWH